MFIDLNPITQFRHCQSEHFWCGNQPQVGSELNESARDVILKKDHITRRRYTDAGTEA